MYRGVEDCLQQLTAYVYHLQRLILLCKLLRTLTGIVANSYQTIQVPLLCISLRLQTTSADLQPDAVLNVNWKSSCYACIHCSRACCYSVVTCKQSLL